MVRAITIAICIFIFTSATSSQAGTVRGQVDSILNSYYTGDNFVIILKPGWTKVSCNNGPSTSGVAFAVGDSYDPATHQRSFALALTAQLSGLDVLLSSAGNTCGSPAYNIQVQD